MAIKRYLDQEGTQLLIDYINNNLSAKADASSLSDYATLTDLERIDLSDYASKTYVDTQIASIPAAEAYDDTEVRGLIDAIEAKTSGLYHFKGSVADLEALAAIENPEVGDTYNLVDTGMNAAWTGSEWDQFGSVTDLSDYVKDEDVVAITTATLNSILYSGKTGIVSSADSLKAMLNNAQSEVEITVNEDIALSSALSIPAGKSVVLDLGGNTISSTAAGMFVQGDLEVSNGSIAANSVGIQVSDGGSLVVNDTAISSARGNGVNATGSGSSLVFNSGSVSAQEYGVGVFSGAEVTINGGHLVGRDNFALGGNGSSGQGNVTATINGGVIEGQITSAGYIAAAVYWPNSGTLTVNGGQIRGAAGIVQRAGNVILNEGADIVANGESGVLGKAGDSRVVVGPYAVVYDKESNYPGMRENGISLTIADGASLVGTDGDIQVLPVGAEGITDNRVTV